MENMFPLIFDVDWTDPTRLSKSWMLFSMPDDLLSRQTHVPLFLMFWYSKMGQVEKVDEWYTMIYCKLYTWLCLKMVVYPSNSNMGLSENRVYSNYSHLISFNRDNDH